MMLDHFDEAFYREVEEAARNRTDVPLAQRMTPYRTQFSNLRWRISQEAFCWLKLLGADDED